MYTFICNIPNSDFENTLFKKEFCLTRELSLINTCCWRADHEILIHDDGASRSELIFVSARQHMC